MWQRVQQKDSVLLIDARNTSCPILHYIWSKCIRSLLEFGSYLRLELQSPQNLVKWKVFVLLAIQKLQIKVVVLSNIASRWGHVPRGIGFLLMLTSRCDFSHKYLSSLPNIPSHKLDRVRQEHEIVPNTLSHVKL